MANLILRLLQFRCITTTSDNVTTDAASSTGTITISDTIIEYHTTRETKDKVCTTIVITETQGITTKCTYYYDNIDNEIKRNRTNANTHTNTDTSTITNNQSPTTTEKGLDCNPTTASDLARVLISIVELIDEYTVEY